MATGETLWAVTARNSLPAITTFPVPVFITFDTDYKEQVLAYDGGSNERAVFEFVWPNNYAGGGITLFLGYSTDGTDTSNAVQMDVNFMAIGDGDDYDTATLGSLTAMDDTPSTASANHVDVTAGVNISHANCGSPAAGDKGYIRLIRNGVSDSNADDMQSHWLRAEEQ